MSAYIQYCIAWCSARIAHNATRKSPVCAARRVRRKGEASIIGRSDCRCSSDNRHSNTCPCCQCGADLICICWQHCSLHWCTTDQHRFAALSIDATYSRLCRRSSGPSAVLAVCVLALASDSELCFQQRQIRLAPSSSKVYHYSTRSVQ